MGISSLCRKQALLFQDTQCIHWDSKPLRFTGDITVSFDSFTKEQVRWEGYCPLKNILATFLKILVLSFSLFRERVSIYWRWVNAPEIGDCGLWPFYRQVIKWMGRWQKCNLRITKFMRSQHTEEESDDNVSKRERRGWRNGNLTKMVSPGLSALEMKTSAFTSCPLPGTGQEILNIFWIRMSIGERLHCGATMGIKWDDTQKTFSSVPDMGPSLSKYWIFLFYHHHHFTVTVSLIT